MLCIRTSHDSVSTSPPVACCCRRDSRAAATVGSHVSCLLPRFSYPALARPVHASDPVRRRPESSHIPVLCQGCYGNSASRNPRRGLQHLTLPCFASLLTCNNALAARHGLDEYEANSCRLPVWPRRGRRAVRSRYAPVSAWPRCRSKRRDTALARPAQSSNPDHQPFITLLLQQGGEIK